MESRQVELLIQLLSMFLSFFVLASKQAGRKTRTKEDLSIVHTPGLRAY